MLTATLSINVTHEKSMKLMWVSQLHFHPCAARFIVLREDRKRRSFSRGKASTYLQFDLKKKKKYIQMWKLPLFFAPSSKEQVVLLLFLPCSWQLLSSHGKCSKLKGALVYRKKKNLSKEWKRCLKVYSHAFTQPPPVSCITCMHCSPVNPSFWIQCRSGGLNRCIEKW